MSKGVLKGVAVIAGAVAVVATGGAALAGAGVFAAGYGVSVGGAIIASTTIATVASVVSAAASLGAQALTKPPNARGSVSQVLIQPDAPTPYVMGEGLFAGVLRHDVGYGPTLDKVPNPYRFMAIVYSLGPVESISPRVDFAPVSGWFNGFLFTDVQTGQQPEPDALSPQWSGAPGWSAAHKLSGLAAIGWSFLFDKKGKRFASGIPPLAAEGKWVKIYDPRKDDTQPGGVGSHRLGDESTYEWSENPALHAAMYAYGRYQNGKRVFGIGLPADGIDWLTVIAWANVCDANAWTIFGVIYEPADRWVNLKDICYAGGAEPVPGGKLTFKYAAPRVALDTITIHDLTDDSRSLTAMQPYKDRLNTVIPKYRSAAHNWELVDAEPVVNDSFLADDGEEKRDVWPFNFVKKVDQAAELAAYRLFDTREIAPITLPCKPRMRYYLPGDCLHVTLEDMDLDTDAVVLSRDIEPVTMKVTLTLMGETPAKHAFCLGRTGVAPPTPALGQTAQDRDELAAEIAAGLTAAQAIVTSTVAFPVTTTDTTISVVAFDATITNQSTVSFPAAELTGLTEASAYVLLWNLDTQTYSAVLRPALVETADPRNVIVRYVITQSADGTYPPTETPPGGDGGGGYGGGGGTVQQ